MGLIDSLFGGSQKNQNGSRMDPNPNQNQNYVQMLSRLMTNPYVFAKDCNLYIPSNIRGARQMVNYLITSGQIDGGMLNDIQAVASRGR